MCMCVCVCVCVCIGGFVCTHHSLVSPRERSQVLPVLLALIQTPGEMIEVLPANDKGANAG